MFGNFFKPQQQQQNQQQGQGQQAPNGQQGQNQQSNQQTVQGPGTMPGSQGHPDGQGEVNPLDSYAKLWENPAGAGPSSPPVFNLDPNTLNSAAASMKFLEGMPPELMQRVQAGDPQAIMEMVTFATQNAYKSSLQHSSMLTDKFVGAYSAYDKKQFAPQVKSQMVGQELSKIPNYSHPAVKAQVDMIAEQMQRQHPDASPEEVANHVKSYMKASLAAMGLISMDGGQQGMQGQTKSAATDWDAWIRS